MEKRKEKEFWSEKIPYIKKLKGFYSKIEYKGVNLWPVMAGDVYPYYYFSHLDKEEEPSLFKRLLINIKSIFFRDNFPVGGNGKILVSYFMPRKDHYELIEKALSKFPEKDLVWIDAFKYKQKNILLRGKIRFPNVLFLFGIWNKFRKAKLKKILKNYYWFYIFKTYFRCRQIEDLEKIFNKINPKAYISFCSSAFPEEAILTLLCKKQKIPTFTLQHGFLQKPSNPFTSVTILNENMISDYNLLWGKNSYNIQKRYVNRSKLILAGNPKYNKIKSNKKNSFNPKKATIFFSVPAYNQGNLELLRIVKKFIGSHPEILFNITAHPMNDIKLFSKNLKYKNVKIIDDNVLAQDLLEKSDFVILYNTTITIEALNYKIPIFRYNGKDFISFWDKKRDSFKNLKELEELFLRIKNKKNYTKLMDFYDKQLKNIFYFEPGKDVPQVYYEEIIKRIKKRIK